MLRAGIITGALASRQGRPASDGTTRQDRTQRTIAAFTYEDGESDDERTWDHPQVPELQIRISVEEDEGDIAA